MTRFARAKGSKSSNLKAPDDSTPWEVMKEQMLQAKKESQDNKNREVAESQRIENYSKFLKEQKVLKRKATWCDFPETESNKKAKKPVDENQPTKNKKKLKKAHNNNTPSEEINVSVTPSIVNENFVAKKKSKKANKNNTTPSEEANVPVTSNNVNVDIVSDKISEKLNNTTTSQETKAPETLNDVNVSNKKKKKKNKRKSEKALHESQQNVEETDVSKEQTVHKEVIDKKKNKQVTDDGKNAQTNMQNNGTQKKKNKKIRGDKPTRRKEINDRSFQLIINGKEVELVRFDGFPIMKKDAERLNELKTNMMKKGIPKTEVNRTIKLERRRAEKALARLKRDVCYNCRKGGHNLSDCPDLRSNIPGVGAAEGICFKCGSTEHRQFECKVQRDKEFRFASCFICKEQGHIARQCPDNPKGLYPNGGCCKLCGDVTHLRKDCPTVQNQKEGTSIKLQTLDTGSNIEDIDLQSKPVLEEAPRKPKKIKF